ncbi:hypothetical protein CROQUDRAFT_95262 [Cronartium quercuum f. sp. fusiforme G11]|uniref:Uncharacterized protein n=1 Tax=Cronartium quercuum f. sp. fusiforme G11 TaxID=708437 RepID=A0A9P6NHQ7_9BASI|nr:hypothetical protein CROQUDRAFT_95262 [Cronartium quercuum f. sp. fusiforme G11]
MSSSTSSLPTSSTSSQTRHEPNSNPSKAPPRGILKNNPGTQEPRSPHLTWDEPNLALNDLNRQVLIDSYHSCDLFIAKVDSTMKITEPKTPFVRYNAETDEVMNLDAIPDFDLGYSTSSARQERSNSSPSTSKEIITDPTNLIRRASTSSTRRGSDSNERRQVLLKKPIEKELEDEEEEEDEELDPDTKAKHDAFVRARKGHYGNEAEAMKKARELAERDDTESEMTDAFDPPSFINGTS